MIYDKKFNKCEHRILVFRITASFSKTTMIFFDCIAKHFTISLSEPVHIKTNAVHMRNLGFSDTHWAHSEDSYKTTRLRKKIWAHVI